MIGSIVGDRSLGAESGVGKVFLGSLRVGGTQLAGKFGGLVIFDAVVELLCLFPCGANVCLAFGLVVLELFSEILVVVLALLDNLIEMFLLVFSRFLDFLPGLSLLFVGPLQKVLLDGLHPRLLLHLPLQLLTHLLLLPYFSLFVLSISLAMCSLSSVPAGSSRTTLFDLILSIE